MITTRPHLKVYFSSEEDEPLIAKASCKKRKCRGKARSALKLLSENELKDEHFGDNLVKVPSGWPANKKLEEDDDYEPPLDDPMISAGLDTQFFLFPFYQPRSG